MTRQLTAGGARRIYKRVTRQGEVLFEVFAGICDKNATEVNRKISSGIVFERSWLPYPRDTFPSLSTANVELDGGADEWIWMTCCAGRSSAGLEPAHRQ